MKKIIFLLLISSSVIAANETTEEVTELEEVVVSTEVSTINSNLARPMITLAGNKLRRKIAAAIGNTLKNELGMTTQSFGPGVGSPVIRGQAGARVRVMQNGLGNQDVSSLSPDHANSVEPILADKIEVLRGASALIYGSGAIGGVVNVINNRIPLNMPSQNFAAIAEQRYDSASNETASALKLDGGQNRLAYHFEGFYRHHGDLSIHGNAIDETAARFSDPSLTDTTLNNTRGILKNSHGWSRGGSAGLSYIGDRNIIGASINHLQNHYGIPNDGTDSEPIHIAMKQSQYDLKIQFNQPMKWIEKLNYQFGYTDYQHTELENDVAATRFLNESFDNRLTVEHQSFAGIKGMIGFQTTHSEFAVLGEEAIVPRSDIANYAGFFIESITLGDLSFEFGGRLENQRINPKQSSGFSYFPLNGSASVLWQINPQHQFSFAATHSQRSPLIQELLSNGFHAATRSYELGNSELTKEFSNNIDLNYRYQTDWAKLEVNLFHNWVNNYIYQQRTGEVFNSDLNQNGDEIGFESSCSTLSLSCLPVEHSQQRNAIFKGFEAKLTLNLLKNQYGNLDLTLFSDYTRGTFAGGDNIPRMPPLRYGFELDYTNQQLSANIRLTRAEAQHFVPIYDSITAGYFLLNLSAEYQMTTADRYKVLLFANAGNLLNQTIRYSTSYLRNFAPEAGRNAEIGIRISY
ncbi:MAG: hypothetical protein RL637_1016 [Pseudomonadota bacterium]|jgi:iron complex outermembrane receptor protein